MTAPRATTTIERGIRQDRHGLQAYVRIDGALRAKRFRPGTPLATLRAWREDQRTAHRHGLTLATTGTAFAADVEHYLTIVAAMPTFEDRAYRLRQWVAAFGSTRGRAAITPKDIRAQLERWRMTGRVDHGPLSAGSLNHRRTALMHFFTVMDGSSGRNPVKDVPAYPEHASEQIRALPWRDWYRLLARMGHGYRGQRGPRRGFARWLGKRTRSKTQARLRLMLWTGWPHAQIMRLTEADIDWTGPRVRLSRRRKGKGHPATWLPLLTSAVRALRVFADLEAWGRFSQSAMHSQLRRAVAAENRWRRAHRRPLIPAGLRPYDARHSALTLMATLTTDERALQDLALHGTARQTRRYTEGATAERLRRAVAAMNATKL